MSLLTVMGIRKIFWCKVPKICADIISTNKILVLRGGNSFWMKA